MAAVRIKCFVSSVAHHDAGKKTIDLLPCWNENPENQAFFSGIPMRPLTIGVIASEAAQQFELGQRFFVDLVPA